MLNALFGRKKSDNWASINPNDLQERLKTDKQLFVLDVRSAQEFEKDGRIVGAHLIPLPTLAASSSELPKDHTIVCVCRSGGRSRAACDLLAKQGFTQIINLDGGMIAWKRAGLPSR